MDLAAVSNAEIERCTIAFRIGLLGYQFPAHLRRCLRLGVEFVRQLLDEVLDHLHAHLRRGIGRDLGDHFGHLRRRLGGPLGSLSKSTGS